MKIPTIKRCQQWKCRIERKSTLQNTNSKSHLASQTLISVCCCDYWKHLKSSLAPSEFGTRYLRNRTTYTATLRWSALLGHWVELSRHICSRRRTHNRARQRRTTVCTRHNSATSTLVLEEEMFFELAIWMKVATVLVVIGLAVVGSRFWGHRQQTCVGQVG